MTKCDDMTLDERDAESLKTPQKQAFFTNQLDHRKAFGVQEVVGSNPASPIWKTAEKQRISRQFSAFLTSRSFLVKSPHR